MDRGVRACLQVVSLFFFFFSRRVGLSASPVRRLFGVGWALAVEIWYFFNLVWGLSLGVWGRLWYM